MWHNLCFSVNSTKAYLTGHPVLLHSAAAVVLIIIFVFVMNEMCSNSNFRRRLWQSDTVLPSTVILPSLTLLFPSNAKSHAFSLPQVLDFHSPLLLFDIRP